MPGLTGIKKLGVLSFGLLGLGFGLQAQERTFDGWKEGVIWVVRPSSNIQASAKGAPFGFDLDFVMQGALALADRYVLLSTEPKGLRLNLEEPEAVLKARMADGKIKFGLASDGKDAGLAAFEVPPGKKSFKLAVRQLDQVALYVVAPDRSSVSQVWCGTVDYRIKLRSADVYELCENVEVKVGGKKFEQKDLPKGLVLDHLDELGDIVIQGLDPQKKPFVHRYTFDLTSVEARLSDAFRTIYPDRDDKVEAKSEVKAKEATADAP